MRKFFTLKKIIAYIIILLVGGGIIYNLTSEGTNPENILTDKAKVQTLKRTVLATGQVTSTTDLSLSFKSPGIVSSVNVKVGDKVKSGQVLANLEQKDQAATLTQARGSLAQAKANLQKVLAGASSEEVVVAQRAVEAAQVTLDNAKKSLEVTKSQQDTLVNNARSALLNSTPESLANPTNIAKPTVSISGTYTGTAEGTYIINVYQSGNGPTISVSGLETSDAVVVANIPLPLGKRGLFVTFSTTSLYSGDSWSVTIPNTKAVNYQANSNAYTSSLETRKNALDNASAAVSSSEVAVQQSLASLALKKAQARPADIDVAEAGVLSAQGQVQAAEATLENTIIRAPSDGTITQVSVKVGEGTSSQASVMKLQDVGSLHVEANISEANIASLKEMQTVEMTFDALGPERKFKGTVQAIDPASTVVSGVVNYKVTAGLEKLDEIKPGMTANLIILVTEKPNVLVVPGRAVIEKQDKKIVRLITDSKTKNYKEVEVNTSLEGDGGLVEITSGLKTGDEVVTLIKE